jgi:hypothetical protein
MTITTQKAITHCHYRAYAEPILRDYLYNTTFASAILNTQLQILILSAFLKVIMCFETVSPQAGVLRTIGLPPMKSQESFLCFEHVQGHFADVNNAHTTSTRANN